MQKVPPRPILNVFLLGSLLISIPTLAGPQRAGAAPKDFPKALFGAWQKQDCKKVIVQAKTVHVFQPWRDWALYLAAQCQLQNRSPKLPGVSDARLALSELALQHPDSPLESHALHALGELDLQEASLTRGASLRRQFLLERGFERLLEQKRTARIRPSDLQTYGGLCKHALTKPGDSPQRERCQSWTRRLLSTTTPGGPEEKAILESTDLPDRKTLALPPAPGNSRLIQAYKDAEPDQRAIEEALALVRENKRDDAEKRFRETLEKYPRSSGYGRIHFWLARFEEEGSHADSARTRRLDLFRRSPFSWYGLHSALSAGLNPAEGISPPPGTNPVPAASRPFDEQISLKESRTIQRATLLLLNNSKSEAALELRELRPRDALSSATILEWSRIASVAGAHSTAFALMQELLQRGYGPALTTDGLKRVFPEPSAELLAAIRKNAKANELDPILALALIKQESAFDSETSSGAGATGYMQLMPFTALEMIPGVERNQMNQPDLNILAGTRYLARMLEKYQGSVPHALAAYNAGPAAVDRWLREGRDSSGRMEDFIENIPYKETRDYVGSILRNRWWYGQLLEGKSWNLAELSTLYRRSPAGEQTESPTSP